MTPKLEAKVVEEGTWRVCDAMLPENDPRRVVAIICREEDQTFSVLSLHGHNERNRLRYFHEALELIAERMLGQLPEENATGRPIPIPHLPPLRARHRRDRSGPEGRATR